MISITKLPDEQWFDCLIRCAAPYGLQDDVTTEYDHFKTLGQTDAEAAFHAASAYDLLDFTSDEDNNSTLASLTNETH